MIIILAVLLLSSMGQAGDVSLLLTMAGSGTPGTNDGVGRSAQFQYLGQGAVSNGVAYLPDRSVHPFGIGARIRRVFGNSTVTTVGGNISCASGCCAASTQDGSGSSASSGFCLFQGSGFSVLGSVLAVPDVEDGNATRLWIADYGHNVVQLVLPNGTTTAVAGDASRVGGFRDTDPDVAGPALFNGPTGLAVLTRPTTVAVSSSDASASSAPADASGGTSSASSARESMWPHLPAGTLVVGDFWNCRLRVVHPTTLRVSTLLGNRECGNVDGRLARPTRASTGPPVGLAYHEATHCLWFTAFNAIRKIHFTAGTVTSVAGRSTVAGARDGVGEAASFNYPSGLAFTGDGDLLVADEGNHLIRKVSADKGLVTTVVGKAGSSGYADGLGTGGGRLTSPTGILPVLSGRFLISQRNVLRLLLTPPSPTFNFSRLSEVAHPEGAALGVLDSGSFSNCTLSTGAKNFALTQATNALTRLPYVTFDYDKNPTVEIAFSCAFVDPLSGANAAGIVFRSELEVARVSLSADSVTAGSPDGTVVGVLRTRYGKADVKYFDCERQSGFRFVYQFSTDWGVAAGLLNTSLFQLRSVPTDQPGCNRTSLVIAPNAVIPTGSPPLSVAVVSTDNFGGSYTSLIRLAVGETASDPATAEASSLVAAGSGSADSTSADSASSSQDSALVGDTTDATASENEGHEVNSPGEVSEQSGEGNSDSAASSPPPTTAVPPEPTPPATPFPKLIRSTLGIALSRFTVSRRAAVGTAVGTLSVREGADSVLYSLVPGIGDRDNAAFHIEGSTLLLAVEAAATKHIYFVRFRATDAASGRIFEQSISIVTE